MVLSEYAAALGRTAEGGRRHINSFSPYAPWHFLNFLPEPQGQGSLRPTFCPTLTGCADVEPSPPTHCRSCSSLSFLRWILRVKSSIWLWAARRTSRAISSARRTK